MSERYEHIYAEQQRMLHKGTIQNADITAWRARRDACDSARCLDSLFHLFWRDKNSMHMAPPRAAQDTSPPARHDPVPVPAPTAVASAPPPAAPGASAPVTPAAASAPARQAEARQASGAAMRADARQAGFVSLGTSPFKTTGTDAPSVDAVPATTEAGSDPGESGAASLALESVLSGFAVIGTGAGFLWHRRRTYARYQPRPAIPAAMVIAYALLLVNALLLPFTLGLK